MVERVDRLIALIGFILMFVSIFMPWLGTGSLVEFLGLYKGKIVVSADSLGLMLVMFLDFGPFLYYIGLIITALGFKRRYLFVVGGVITLIATIAIIIGVVGIKMQRGFRIHGSTDIEYGAYLALIGSLLTIASYYWKS